jgi:hypothetical protein
VFEAVFEQSRVKLSSGDGNRCGNKSCRILTVEVLRKLKQVLMVSIGTQQDHCLNDHHKSNRWKTLIKGWLVSVKGNTGPLTHLESSIHRLILKMSCAGRTKYSVRSQEQLKPGKKGQDD